MKIVMTVEKSGKDLWGRCSVGHSLFVECAPNIESLKELMIEKIFDVEGVDVRELEIVEETANAQN